jgi:predicted dehydrogenase
MGRESEEEFGQARTYHLEDHRLERRCHEASARRCDKIGGMSDDRELPVAVIGVGRMGRHHARIYPRLAGAKLVGVVDTDPRRATTLADELGCAAYNSADDLLRDHPELRAVSVAVPTRHHLAAAQPFLERRIACLVEKPLAPNTAEARALADLAARHGAVLQVGHTERFNPAVRALIGLKLTPAYIEVQRVSPLTFRSMDVGVVMDMMIHDLDIVLALAGSPLRHVDAAGFVVVGEHEDIANARLVFASGCVANLTASRLALKTDRKLKVLGQAAYVSLDYRKRKGLVIRKSDDEAAVARLREQIAAGADLTHLDYSRFVRVSRLRMDDGSSPLYGKDPLTSELGSFLAAVRDGTSPEVDGEAGYAAVEAAQRILASILENRRLGVAERMF